MWYTFSRHRIRRNRAPKPREDSVPSECPTRFFRADRTRMKTKINCALMLSLVLTIVGATLTMAQQAPGGSGVPPLRSQGPCDIYASAGDACVAAHSTTRALYAAYNGPLYQVLRQSDGKTLDIRVVEPAASPVADPGGYAGRSRTRIGSAPAPIAGSVSSTINLPGTTISLRLPVAGSAARPSEASTPFRLPIWRRLRSWGTRSTVCSSNRAWDSARTM